MAHIGNLGDGLGNQFTDFRRCCGVASVSWINIRGPIACLKHKPDCIFNILSFMLQHSGSMIRGVPTMLTVTVVPDSGTDQLAGLSGRMTIIIAEGRHSYEFEYSIGP